MKDIINSFPLKLTAQGQLPKRKWFGWGQSPASLAQALLQSVEQLFNAVNGDTPEDKKNNILTAVGTIYDSYIAKALPLSLAPVNPLIRYLVVSLIVPQIIDWLISKEQAVGQVFLYNNNYLGSMPTEEEKKHVQKLWNQHVQKMLHEGKIGVPELKPIKTSKVMIMAGKEPIIGKPDSQWLQCNGDGTLDNA